MTGDSRMENSRFSIGHIGGDAVGVGPSASGFLSKGGSAAPELVELQRRIQELQQLVERHAAELDDSEVARDAVADAESEVRSGNPQPKRLRMLLSAITGAASGVSAVTTAASGIRALLNGLG
jgi:chromosome segregation ATPase